MKIAYMGLERLESRYSHQLEDWNAAFFTKQPNVEWIPIHGTMPAAVEGQIVTGSVLDAHGRTHWSLTQNANLVAMLQRGELTDKDVVLYEDMFTPGIESLAYIFDQTPKNMRPRVYVRCLAQTIDPDDFVHRTGMFKWMRHYEHMVSSFVDGVLCASKEMVAHLHIAGLQDVPIYVAGLPFGKQEVLSRVPNPKKWEDRERIVLFAARWDQEKQPQFFMDLLELVKKVDPSIKFAVATGMKTLRSNDDHLLARARAYQASGDLKIFENLSKNEYYEILANSRVLFNCALQDWVSNTVSEADTFGTQTLYPAYRSFPEVFANDGRHMYLPWSLEDAAKKLLHLVDNRVQHTGKVSDYQDQTIERTYDVLVDGIDSPYLYSAGADRTPANSEYRRATRLANF